jgi:hypothetical protein
MKEGGGRYWADGIEGRGERGEEREQPISQKSAFRRETPNYHGPWTMDDGPRTKHPLALYN